MSAVGHRAAAVEGKAQLLSLLAEDPALATPRLVRDLWERAVALHRTDARAAREVAECAWLAAERVGDLGSRALAHRAPMGDAQFGRWLTLFHTTVDELFEGPTASQAKDRAVRSAASILARMRLASTSSAEISAACQA